MDDKREEIYERIPWESIENSGKDRQWLILGIAAAVVAGALGYSFVSNRPIAPPSPTAAAAANPASTGALPAPPPLPPATTTPMVVAEADLYAVPPERLTASAAGHAEWFIVEYLTMDGSESGQEVLRQLLPPEVPLPSAGEGTLVFVEWAKAIVTDEISPGRFRVEVLTRYMVAEDGKTYRRIDPELLAVEIEVGESGPRVLTAPSIRPVLPTPATSLDLAAVPTEFLALVEQQKPGAEIVGGLPGSDGSWEVVVMSTGPGGITRPETVHVGS